MSKYVDHNGQVIGMRMERPPTITVSLTGSDNRYDGYFTTDNTSPIDTTVVAAPPPDDTLARQLRAILKQNERNDVSEFYRQYMSGAAEPKKPQAENTLESVVKNRSGVFASFVQSISDLAMKFGWKSAKQVAVAEQDADAKRRAQYWAGNIFVPVDVYIEKLLVAKKLKNGSSELASVDVRRTASVLPTGIDIWGTIGGFAQQDDRMDWGKAFLSLYVPGEIEARDGTKISGACFMLAHDFRLAQPKAKSPVSHQRKIEL